jgi:2-keto-4-pentenoate hydratase/2-oxohepta-3-ene-1,7-dioic acid hydratase in catechol pathway
MQFISYLSQQKKPCWGIVIEQGHVFSSEHLGLKQPTLKTAIASGKLSEARRLLTDKQPDLSLADLTLLPPLWDFGAMYCTGLNYVDHAQESGKSIPTVPRIFIRLPETLVGHSQDIIAPTVSTHFDYEGELAVVIGKAGRDISEDKAGEHIFGYTCFMDGSIRDWQKVTTTLGKNFEKSGALGPGIVPKEDIPDVQELTLVTRLNGEMVQQANTRDMIFTIGQLIHFLSRMITLRPGDIIATGTPDGVGQSRTPPLWLKRGDEVSVEVNGLGKLKNRIR